MSDFPYPDAQAHQRTVIARRYTGSAEAWLRRLVHDTLAPDGATYITGGQWSSKLKGDVAAKFRDNPGKYSREVDATTFGQLVAMVCHHEYWPRWSAALATTYPLGVNEARHYLARLRDIRNELSHGGGCSTRQLEQAVCYSNDLADGIKAYFRMLGASRDFDVPAFLRFQDNLGNFTYLTPGPYYRVVDFSTPGLRELSPDDTLVAEVEVDASFDPDFYEVVWWVKTSHEHGEGTAASIKIENRHVGERMELQFKLKTKADWHRGHDCDDVLDIYYRVLPP